MKIRADFTFYKKELHMSCTADGAEEIARNPNKYSFWRFSRLNDLAFELTRHGNLRCMKYPNFVFNRMGYCISHHPRKNMPDDIMKRWFKLENMRRI